MAVEAYLPTLTTVTVTAAIDSINPCAVGVLVLLISVLIAARQSTKKMLLLGGVYILSIYVTYLMAGLGMIYFLSKIPLYMSEYIAIAVGLLIIFAGLLEIKDYFWYGRWFSLTIPAFAAKKLDTMAAKATVPGMILLGAFVAGVELPCTGAPYLAIVTLLSQYFDFKALLLLLYYNVIFVAPLAVILGMVAAGKKLHEVKKWKQESRGVMRLLIGLMLVGMGWLLMLIANGTINFG